MNLEMTPIGSRCTRTRGKEEGKGRKGKDHPNRVLGKTLGRKIVEADLRKTHQRTIFNLH